MCLSFWALATPYHMIISSFIYSPATISFIYLYAYHYVYLFHYVYFITHLPFGGHLGLFHLLAIENKATTSMDEQVSL